MNLAIIVPLFNPCGYDRPRQNFVSFIQSLQQQVDTDDVFVIEALFPGQESDRGWWTRAPIQADARHFMWQKESLINYAIRHLPAKYDAVAWVDADLLFSCPWWYSEACRVLGQAPVVQLFEWIRYLGPRGHTESRGYGTVAAGDRATWRAPGGAIACRRELLEHGIYDRHVLGGGDEIFMEACMGLASRFYDRLNPPFRDSVREWCNSFCSSAWRNSPGQHDVGYIPGTVRHLWHGNREGRQYTSRHQTLADHDFDPEADVRLSSNGMLEWSSDKPALHAAVRDYFRGRAEDQITASVS